MSNKVLFCATVDFHFSSFHLPVLEWFKQQNWEVHVAAQGDMDLPFVDKKYNIPIERSPFRRENIEAYRQLKTIIEQNDYRIIHSHTPMGGVLTRLAARGFRKKGTKVIYTAHGFHFCKGSSLLNWMLYYPIEKSLARITDCLITINNEDYRLAVNHMFKAQQIERVNGVGINTERYRPVTSAEKMQLRQGTRYGLDDFLMFYAAEFNRNKNHQLLIRSLAGVKDQLPRAKLLFAGRGDLQEECRQLAIQLDVEHMVEFLGYRNDIEKLLPLCDAAVSGSLREGLPVNIMEAMACGLPVIATRNRGHLELVKDHENGFIVDSEEVNELSKHILALGLSFDLRHRMGLQSAEYIRKYDLKQVVEQLNLIYSRYMTGAVQNGT
ncbi:glycosyltransferase family 4 protein [Paenibacillus sp. BR2-3]|uniref:glycosyltransferase family 4 protein n=1 Tax=Paenibacillus sp. BR2-3 TaxID=3048494 RepID=UPI0039775EB2